MLLCTTRTEVATARNRHFGDAAQIFRCKIFAQGPEDLFPFILSVARRKQRAGGLFIQGCAEEREATGITARLVLVRLVKVRQTRLVQRADHAALLFRRVPQCNPAADDLALSAYTRW